MIRSNLIGLAVAIVAFAIAQLGCVSVRGGAAAQPTTQPTDQICLSRDEVARIQAFKIRCRSTLAQVRAEATHDLAVANTNHKAAIQTCQTRLTGCLKQATIVHKCPSCLTPALTVGIVAGVVGLVAGVVVGVVATLAVKGSLP